MNVVGLSRAIFYTPPSIDSSELSPTVVDASAKHLSTSTVEVQRLRVCFR